MSEEAIKSVLRMFPYGFYALTSRHEDDLNVMVVNWVSQVSFTPRLVAVGLAKSAHSHGLVEKGRVFGLNLFHKENTDAIMPFTKGRSKNPDKMSAANYTEAPVTGVPVLDGAVAYIEFEVEKVVDTGGDHDIVIGKPVGAGVNQELGVDDVLSLVTLGWSYAG